jgi:RNA polymerase II-associated factor 1
MSKSQDYIARIRYQNDLPPPLLPPKLLKYDGKDEEQIGSSNLLSSLFRKENVNNMVSLNNDLGLPIDMISVPLVFEATEKPKKENDKEKPATLHPLDRVLLRDPQIERAVKNQPAVSFLRRTEYIGSTKMNNSNPVSRSATPQLKQESDSPAAQLLAIESTFENATKTLKDESKVKHPFRKNLRAKRVWSLLPDVSRMDQKFSTVKFGSNSISKLTDLEYKTSVFRQVRLEDIDWVSFFTTDEDSAKGVKRTLDDLSENIPKEVTEDGERFKYVKRDDFDLNTRKLNGEIQEIALRFDAQSGNVYFNPISRKAELKRRKIQESHRELLEKNDLDEIYLRFREPTVAELNKRNNIRHQHDSVTYEATETVDEEEDDLEQLRKDSDVQSV